MLSENIGINERGHVTFAGYDTVDLAKKHGTPLYLMDETRIRENCRMYTKVFQEAFGDNGLVLYASKANAFKRIYEIKKAEDRKSTRLNSSHSQQSRMPAFA